MFRIREPYIINSLLLLGVYIISWLLIYNLSFSYSPYLFVGLWTGFILYLARNLLYSYKIDLKSRFNIQTVIYAILIALLQILIYVGFGFIYGFGYSPYGHSGYTILFNLVFFLTPLFARELYRFVTLVGGKDVNIVKRIISTAILLGLISIPLPNYNIVGGTLYSHLYLFLISVIVPSIAYNLVGSYLIVYGGIFSSFTYLAMLKLFELFSPILPSIDWTLTILVGVLVPIFSILLLESSYPYNLKKRLGTIKDRSFLKMDKQGKKLILSLSTILLLLWFVNGFLGIHPTVIVSDSMNPTLKRGDMVIVVDSHGKNINVGDIIEYINVQGLRIVHRVIDSDSEGNIDTFVTKGDANAASDGTIYSFQVQGKVIYSIPYLGWLTIYTKNIILGLSTYVTDNPSSFSIIIIFFSILVTGRRIKKRRSIFLGEFNG